MKEVVLACNSCVHAGVCRYETEYEDIVHAVHAANVHKQEPDGKVRVIPLSNFKCFDNIAVTCNFYKKGTPKR